MAVSMSDDARRGYTMLARLFLVVGGAFALLALLQLTSVIHLFNGNPMGVALVVLIIGVLLEWTVRTAPPPSDAPAGERGGQALGNDERRIDEQVTEGRGVDPRTRDHD